ncbi:hypothetical protein KGP26_15245 [Serratia sp. JSRIV002]|uniref:hypothetical protein n=1 Tax=Serratia sp. JSRIV002 TaxID=2831894 RepID=UPI001CBCCD0E|nr:hypothetical protein [Serratia sp. JSRIV002]UAN49156.1 hypothetical protein KGP26_15245 [Serratia sp. JSRIV002]
MTPIDKITGSRLMRLWGVPSWPEIEADYLLWNGVGVFVLLDFGDHVDMHMAMKKGERHRCREAVADVLALIGPREVHAPILAECRHVCNLARKFGFEHERTERVEFTDGTSGDVILMIKRC